MTRGKVPIVIVVRLMLVGTLLLGVALRNAFAEDRSNEGARHHEDPPDFDTQVAPILITRCLECHQQPDASGGLTLTTRENLVAGGDSGKAIETDSPDESYLLQRLKAGEMPPEQKGQSQKLPAEEIGLLQRWIASGAKWPKGRKLDRFERSTDVRAGRDWWSLQPIVRPPVPTLKNGPQPDHPIDAFIAARLSDHDLTAAPPANRRTLIRRLYYDLIGLPPTRQQIEAFVADESDQAFEKLIDRLLASPQYGVRWTRYWLDLVRYADTSGYERDQEKPFAWKYRDWVVDALNRDMPYAQFIVHQIAGDEIDRRNEQSVIATGFLRLGTWNDEPNDPADYQYDRLEDMVHTTASAFLGLTVKCARCHSHKFDPILQEDYYRMAAAFWAGPIGARDRKLLGGPTAEEVGFADVLAWTDIGPQPPPLHVLGGGERHRPMQQVSAASLSSIPTLERSFGPPPKGSRTSRRRLQLARWIADPRHPLTPRVLVNRLWQHHFGQAIVRTPNNFGFLADPPTHPQLLDWLAAEFIKRGGSLKQMHKLMVTSQTWQQSSLHPRHQQYLQMDPSNRFCWHAPRRRLDAEAIRDSMLAVSGELELTIGGESFRPTLSPEALEGLSRKSAAWKASPPEKQRRRSLYMFMKRGLLPPMMTVFDLCDATGSCGQRSVTTVPTQALALMNNRFVHQRGQHLAAQIISHRPQLAQQVEMVWSRILGRRPTKDELNLAMNHVTTQSKTFASSQEPSADVWALASLCHVLMNSNEFLYVD